MLSRVQAEDVLSLARPWVNRPNVLAALHFPNRSNDSVFFYSVIRNLFRRSCGCGCCILVAANFCACIIVCINRVLINRGLVLRHCFGGTPLKKIRTLSLSLLVSRIVTQACGSVQQQVQEWVRELFGVRWPGSALAGRDLSRPRLLGFIQ